MTTASEQLLGYADDSAFYEVSRAELEPLWLAAANERLAEQRERIPVLARLADDLGIKEFESLSDLIPLLFAHSNYKSYPEAFIDNGRWNLMNQWLDTLSSNRVEGIDVDGVTDQDDWIERLHANGHPVYVTSGTTGKNSYLPATVADREFSLSLLDNQMNWTYGQPNQDRAVFVLGPKYGPHRAASHFRRIAELFGRPEATFFLTEDQMRLSEVSRSATLRRKLAAGTAMPSEIAALERESATRQTEMAAKLDELVDKLIEYRREPMVIGGFWAQYWMIVERARARGVRPGEFHRTPASPAAAATRAATCHRTSRNRSSSSSASTRPTCRAATACRNCPRRWPASTGATARCRGSFRCSSTTPAKNLLNAATVRPKVASHSSMSRCRGDGAGSSPATGSASTSLPPTSA